MLVIPDRLVLVACPTCAEGEYLVVKGKEGEVARYYVMRFTWHRNGQPDTYLYPPVWFLVTVLENFTAFNPNIPMVITHESCAKCRGFEIPAINRIHGR